MNALESFASQFPKRSYRKGSKLFTTEEASFFLYLIEGNIKLSQIGERGQTVNLHVFYPGSCMSLLSLVGPSDSYDYEAMSDVEVYQIPKDDFMSAIQSNAAVTYELLIHATQGLKGLLYRIQHSASVTAYERVASLLVYFAQHQNPISVTHQEIAEWLGLTRENVTLQLQKLESDKLIVKRSKHIEVPDVERLRLIDSYSE